MRRQLYTGGGIANLQRQGYGLGDIVKKAGKVVKQVFKSDVGKAALLGAGLYGLGGGTFFGKGFPGMGGGFSMGNILPNIKNLGTMGQVALGTGAALAFGGGDPTKTKGFDMAKRKGSVEEYLRRYYKEYKQSDWQTGWTQDEEDAFVAKYTSEYNQGGRVGLQAGGQPVVDPRMKQSLRENTAMNDARRAINETLRGGQGEGAIDKLYQRFNIANPSAYSPGTNPRSGQTYHSISNRADLEREISGKILGGGYKGTAEYERQQQAARDRAAAIQAKKDEAEAKAMQAKIEGAYGKPGDYEFQAQLLGGMNPQAYYDYLVTGDPQNVTGQGMGDWHTPYNVYFGEQQARDVQAGLPTSQQIQYGQTMTPGGIPMIQPGQTPPTTPPSMYSPYADAVTAQKQEWDRLYPQTHPKYQTYKSTYAAPDPSTWDPYQKWRGQIEYNRGGRVGLYAGGDPEDYPETGPEINIQDLIQEEGIQVGPQVKKLDAGAPSIKRTGNMETEDSQLVERYNEHKEEGGTMSFDEFEKFQSMTAYYPGDVFSRAEISKLFRDKSLTTNMDRKQLHKILMNPGAFPDAEKMLIKLLRSGNATGGRVGAFGGGVMGGRVGLKVLRDLYDDEEEEAAQGGRIGYGLGGTLKRMLGLGRKEGRADSSAAVVQDPDVLREKLMNHFRNKFGYQDWKDDFRDEWTQPFIQAAQGGRIGYQYGGGGADYMPTDPGPMGNPAVIEEIDDMREFRIANPGIEDVADYSLEYPPKKKKLEDMNVDELAAMDLTIPKHSQDPRNMTTEQIVAIIKSGRSTPEMFKELMLRGYDVSGGVTSLDLSDMGEAFSFDESKIKGEAIENLLFKLRENNPDIHGEYSRPFENYPTGPYEGGLDDWRLDNTTMKAKGGRIGYDAGSDLSQFKIGNFRPLKYTGAIDDIWETEELGSDPLSVIVKMGLTVRAPLIDVIRNVAKTSVEAAKLISAASEMGWDLTKSARELVGDVSAAGLEGTKWALGQTDKWRFAQPNYWIERKAPTFWGKRSLTDDETRLSMQENRMGDFREDKDLIKKLETKLFTDKIGYGSDYQGGEVELYPGQKDKYAQGGRIGALGGGVMGIGTPGMRLPGIPQMAPDGLEYNMKAGGFQNLGAQEGKDDVNAKLAKNEFVMTADAVRGAGGGNIEVGAQRMYDTMKQLEGKVV